MDLLDGDVELTEFIELDVKSIKGVKTGANGFPPLLMKGIAEPGAAAETPAEPAAEAPEFDREAAVALVKAIVGRKVDESPDIAGGTAVLAQIADLIIAEAQELKAGNAGEICDIQQLACAAEMIWCWRTGEEAVASGSVQPATALMQSVQFEGSADEFAAYIKEAVVKYRDVAKAKHSADDRRKLAEQGNALSDGSYPIADEEDLKSAAILAQSGHGDVDGAKRLIGRRAKELGVKNPLDNGSDTAKSQIAPEGTSVDTVTQDTGGLAKAVEEAVAKATQPLVKEIADLKSARDLDRAELAKVKATPVPGGPVMSVTRPARAAEDDHAVKALRYERQAETLADPREADLYRQLAAQERAKITS